MRTHTRPRSAVITSAIAVVVAVVGLLVATMVASAQPGAEITLSKSRVQLGETIQVIGKGFAPGVPVTVQVCGAPDKQGRLACGPGLADITVLADGSVNQMLAVDEPSGPCPCSVVIDSLGSAPVAARIDLVNHPVAKAPRAPEIVVESAVIESGKGLGRLFGLPSKPTLVLTLRNVGYAPAAPTLNLSLQDGDEAGNPIIDPGAPEIAPDEEVELSVPLEFGAMAQGEHSVSGQVVVGDLYAPVEATTTVGPWGLYVLVIVVLGGGALLRARSVSVSDQRPVRSRVTSQSSVEVPAARRPESVTPRAPEPDTVPTPLPTPVAAPAPVHQPPVHQAPVQQPPAYQPPVHQSPGELVGPPRLAATPLAPLPGLTRSDTLVSPMVPQQASRPAEQPSAPASPDLAVPPRLNVLPRSTTAEDDAARVAEAMAAIRERSASAPAQLPDRYEVERPSGRRAERGGKRAARPAKGQGWITRR